MMRKNIVIGIMCTALALSSITAFASYGNSKGFNDVVLPESSGNTTLVSNKKTTNLNYGRVKISKYVNCKKVTCWFRTTLSDGSQHYWLPYKVDICDGLYHKIVYCDKKEAYYKKGVLSDVRAENADEALNFKVDKVSGTADFN